MDNRKTVLLVEDDAIIAMDMEMNLSDLGWLVLGPTATAQGASDILKTTMPDLALLDFNIRGGTSENLAMSLIEQSVPVIFLSGDNKATDIQGLKDCKVLSKPVSTLDLEAAIKSLS